MLSSFKAFQELNELNEHIVKRDNSWVVMNKDKTKVLGTHSDHSDAVKQLQAIEIAKHGG